MDSSITPFKNAAGKSLTVAEVLASPVIQQSLSLSQSASGAGCSCPPAGAGSGGVIYPIPNSFTLVATGTGANVKLQSFDYIVDSVNGSLGANIFTINELPDRAGLGVGAVALLGVDVLRNYLATHAILVDYINYSASSSAQLSNPLKVYRGQPDGTVTQQTMSISKNISNMQFNATLVPIMGNWLLTSNTALQMLINNTIVVNLTFAIKNILTYDKVS